MQGKNASQVVSDLTGLDIPRLLAGANETVSGLQQVGGPCQMCVTVKGCSVPAAQLYMDDGTRMPHFSLVTPWWP